MYRKCLSKIRFIWITSCIGLDTLVYFKKKNAKFQWGLGRLLISGKLVLSYYETFCYSISPREELLLKLQQIALFKENELSFVCLMSYCYKSATFFWHSYTLCPHCKQWKKLYSFLILWWFQHWRLLIINSDTFIIWKNVITVYWIVPLLLKLAFLSLLRIKLWIINQILV